MVRQTARENRDSLAVLVFSFVSPRSGAGRSACPFVLTMTREDKLKFYHSTEWKKMSPYILRRDHYECQECRKKTGKIRTATLVHHIIPYEDRPDLGLDEDNLEAVCDRCHNIIHGRVGAQLNQKKKKPVTEEKW